MSFEVHLDVLDRRIQDAIKGLLAVKSDVRRKNDVLPPQEDMVPHNLSQNLDRALIRQSSCIRTGNASKSPKSYLSRRRGGRGESLSGVNIRISITS